MEGDAYNSIAAGAIIATSINFRLDYAQSEINRRHTSYENKWCDPLQKMRKLVKK